MALALALRSALNCPFKKTRARHGLIFVSTLAWVATWATGLGHAQKPGRAKEKPALETPQSLDPLAMDQQTYVLGSLLITLYHELGHALVDIHDIPILGREEDAVDAFALVELIVQLREDGANPQIADRLIDYGYASIDQWRQVADEEGAPYDEDYFGPHALHRQRMFTSACLLYGGNSQAFGAVAETFAIPDFYFDTCAQTFLQAQDGWTYMLDTFGAFEDSGQAAEDSSNDLLFVFEPAERDQHAHWVQIAETWPDLTLVQRHFSDDYVLPRPIRVIFRSCSEENAFYNPDGNEVILCYELMAAYARHHRANL